MVVGHVIGHGGVGGCLRVRLWEGHGVLPRTLKLWCQCLCERAQLKRARIKTRLEFGRQRRRGVIDLANGARGDQARGCSVRRRLLHRRLHCGRVGAAAAAGRFCRKRAAGWGRERGARRGTRSGARDGERQAAGEQARKRREEAGEGPEQRWTPGPCGGARKCVLKPRPTYATGDGPSTAFQGSLARPCRRG